jgi:hypothetical protein
MIYNNLVELKKLERMIYKSADEFPTFLLRGMIPVDAIKFTIMSCVFFCLNLFLLSFQAVCSTHTPAVGRKFCLGFTA